MWKTAPEKPKTRSRSRSRNQPNDGTPDQRGGREQAPQAEGTEAAPAPAPAPTPAERRGAQKKRSRWHTLRAAAHNTGEAP